jgi:hypothetical protein
MDATRAFPGKQPCSYSKPEATGRRKGVAMRRTPQLFEESSSIAEAQERPRSGMSRQSMRFRVDEVELA